MFPIYSSAIKYLCAKYTIIILHGEKRLGGHPSSEENRDPPPQEEGEIPPTQAEQEEEEDVVELVTTTGDREVVDPDPFTSESAQILIREIMGCNLELENLKKNINDVIQKTKNIIDVLGRVKTPPNPLFFLCATILKMFERFLEKPNLVDAHSVSTCVICHHGRSMDAFWGCNPFLNNKVAERKGFLPQNTSLDPP
ncbi:hypothetical protein AB205_0009090 [Aquarana catesbeiana]|uniref:Uncharacterized protein n=1 Tax=Aquarana catesbeiana TaxID=8400 RepID=A0A2G9Q8C4_AQUCT|nr:hypothetical protein AB205_0009090 [Aquarana catesbeiana]